MEQYQCVEDVAKITQDTWTVKRKLSVLTAEKINLQIPEIVKSGKEKNISSK